jgi:hypothetical protein
MAQNAYSRPQGQIHGSWWDIAKVIATSIKEGGDLQEALTNYQTSMEALFQMSDDVLNAWTVIGAIGGTSWDTDLEMTEENGVYGAAIQGIAAKDIDGALYACGVYTDASGNTYSTGILPYSLGFYCGNQAKGDGALADLASAIAVYGYYAGIYFAK